MYTHTYIYIYIYIYNSFARLAQILGEGHGGDTRFLDQG